MKIQCLGISNKEKTLQSQGEQPVESVGILEARMNEDKVYLRVAMSQ